MKASALLWLLTYAVQHLIAWRGKRLGLVSPEPVPGALFSALVLVGAVVLTLITDPERALLGAYMVLVVGALALASLGRRSGGHRVARGIS